MNPLISSNCRAVFLLASPEKYSDPDDKQNVIARFFHAAPQLRQMASRALCVLPVIGVIALSCTDAAGGWCSRGFHSVCRSCFSEGQEAFWTIRFLAEKSIHVSMFTSLGAVLSVAFSNVRRKSLLALAAGWAIGCCSELFQRLFPTRDPSIRDVLINWSSVGAGVAISYCMQKIKERRSLTVKTAGDGRARKPFFVNFLLALKVPTVLSLIATALLVCQTGRESGRSVCLVPS